MPHREPQLREREHRTQRHRTSVYDFTRQCFTRYGFSRAISAASGDARRHQTTSTSAQLPQLIGSVSSEVPSLHSSSKMARRRWYAWVCAGFLFSLAVNIGSIAFVAVKLRGAAERSATASNRDLMELFKQQEGFGTWQSIRAWQRHEWVKKTANNDGSNRNPDTPPSTVHATLINRMSDVKSNEELATVKHWQMGSKYQRHFWVLINNNTGDFTASATGLYQIYSSVAFTTLEDQSDKTVTFEQEIRLDTSRDPLLRDKQSSLCSQQGSICYTSVLFAILKLEKGQKVYVMVKPINQLSSDTDKTFFGLLKIN